MLDLVNHLPITTTTAHQAWPMQIEPFLAVNWYDVKSASTGAQLVSYAVQSANDNYFNNQDDQDD